MSGRVTVRLYFGEAKVSEFGRLCEEAGSGFANLGMPHDSVVFTSKRGGVHFGDCVRMEPGAAEGLDQRLEGLR